MIYITSDTHFNHDRQFIYNPRGYKTCEKMNQVQIEKWNHTIKKNDIVYMLGDFFLSDNLDFVKQTLSKLNGKIHLIIGNHDTQSKLELYEQCPNIVEIVWATQIEYKGRKFYLSHYPTLTADLNSNPDNCVFNLYGHTHSKEKFFEDRPYMYNVAVDAHNGTPVSIEEIYNDVENEIKKCISYLV